MARARGRTMAADAILGIDVGTTAVKAAVIGLDGAVRARFSAPHATHRGEAGRAEQDPDDWVRGIDRAMAAFAGHRVAAVGLCSQVNTHVFVDAAGVPLLPAILWQDVRAGEVAAALDARVTEAQKTAWWGAPMPIDASHALARMAWVAAHRPDAWARTRHVLLPKDHCLRALTGSVATDPLSNIGLVGPDLAHVAEALALVPGAADRVAPLRGVTEVVGTVIRGPFRGVPVVCGTMDAWAGLAGACGGREGAAVYLSGTSEVVGIASRRVVPTPGAIVFPGCEGVRMHAAPTQSGGDAVRWFREVAGIDEPDVSDLVAGAPRSAATPLFLPQLEGERAPLWDPTLRGAFVGLTRRTGRADLARAVLEGVALSARHALRTLEASSGVAVAAITCGGGGFRSETWTRIRADVLGVPLSTIAAGEPGVLGAAMLAGVGAGTFGSLAEAGAALIRVERAVEPDMARHATYDALFDVYLDAVAAQADLGRRLAGLPHAEA